MGSGRVKPNLADGLRVQIAELCESVADGVETVSRRILARLNGARCSY